MSAVIDPPWPGQKLLGNGFFSTPYDGVGALSQKRGFTGKVYFIDIPEADSEKGYGWPRPAAEPSIPWYSCEVNTIADPLLKTMIAVLPPQQIEGTYLAFTLHQGVPTNVRCCVGQGVITKWLPRPGRDGIFMMGAIKPDPPYPGAEHPHDVYFDQRSLLLHEQVYGGTTPSPIITPISMHMINRRVIYAVRHGKKGFSFEWAAISVVVLPEKNNGATSSSEYPTPRNLAIAASAKHPSSGSVIAAPRAYASKYSGASAKYPSLGSAAAIPPQAYTPSYVEAAAPPVYTSSYTGSLTEDLTISGSVTTEPSRYMYQYPSGLPTPAAITSATAWKNSIRIPIYPAGIINATDSKAYGEQIMPQNFSKALSATAESFVFNPIGDILDMNSFDPIATSTTFTSYAADSSDPTPPTRQ
jgi:hypothetical protein